MLNRRRISSAVDRRQTFAVGLAGVLAFSGLVAVGGNQILKTQSEGIGPVDTTADTMPLADADNVTVDDAAISTQGDADPATPHKGTVKEIRRDKPFSMFALTWKGQKDVAAFFRAEKEDGSWSQWYSADPYDMDTPSPNGITGTEPVFLEPTKAVQVSTHGLDVYGTTDGATSPLSDAPAAEQQPADKPAEKPADKPSDKPAEAPKPEAPKPADKPADSDAAPLPNNWDDIVPVADELDTSVEAVFIDGNVSAGVAPATDYLNTNGMPKVVSRAGWGANEAKRCQGPHYDSKLLGATVHHTAGSNNYTPAQSAGIVRGIYHYHGQTLGWCDVGYNALVDKYGTIYEGRYGGLSKNVQGAHAGGFNQGTFGISMMGDYSSVQPASAMVESVGKMVGWRLKTAGVNPLGSTNHIAGGYSGSRYARGVSVKLPNIFAHRDVGNTTCPGDAGYAQMSTIRHIANNVATGKVTNQAPDATDTDKEQAPPVNGPVTPPAKQQRPSTPTNNGGQNNTVNQNTGGQGTDLAAGGATLLALALGLASGKDFKSVQDITKATGRGQTVGDIVLFNDVTLKSLPVIVKAVLDVSGRTDLAQKFRDIEGIYGLVMGLPISGVQYGAKIPNQYGQEEQVSYVLTENGIITKSDSVAAHALWGKIADAWASQGFETGPLGLPLSEQYANSSGLQQVDFQGGSITLDEATGKTDIKTTK